MSVDQDVSQRRDQGLRHVHVVAFDLGETECGVDTGRFDAAKQSLPVGVADYNGIVDVHGQIDGSPIVLIVALGETVQTLDLTSLQ